MSDSDYSLALKLQKQFDEEQMTSSKDSQNLLVKKKQNFGSIVDPDWEITDPNPNIHVLFGAFNVKYFWNTLGAVEVKWSPRMYTCAGICTYKGRAGCIVSLSLPLLKFRPRKDLIETLLHEMIHAYLFITKNNKDRSGHGPEFCKHMGRINKEAGTNITIYHAFHDEVNHYKTHVWRCNGSCKANPPYFGYVRRVSNRAPGPNDFWYADHQRSCGGTFDKVSEPDGFVAKPRKKLKTEEKSYGKSAAKKSTPVYNNQSNLKNFVTTSPKTGNSANKKTVENGVIKPLKSGGLTTKSYSTSKVVLSSNKPAQAKNSNQDQSSSISNIRVVKNNIFGFGNFNQQDENGSKNGVNNEKGRSIIPFTGKGHVLGSGSSNCDVNKSSLLGNNNLNKSKNEPTTSRQEPVKMFNENLSTLGKCSSGILDLIDSSDDDDVSGSGINCPVCNVEIKRGVSINEHLDDCNVLEKVFNSSRHESLSDSDDDDNFPTFRPPSPEESTDPPVNCPNCNSVHTVTTINEHLDQCLSFE